MNKKLKFCVGIDVSQKELDVCLGYIDEHQNPHFVSQRKFKNTMAALKELVKWIRKSSQSDIKIVVVMEATGVYHQDCAYHLHANNFNVSIELPNKISNYVRSLNQKTKTDKKDAEAICRFGLERNVTAWQPPKEIYRLLCETTRERTQLTVERSMMKNKLHAENAQHFPNQNAIDRLNERIDLLNKQIKEIEKELKTIVKTDKEIQEDIRRAETIVGVGFITAVTVHAETRGFELIENKKQLSGYVGYDVRQKQSGTSIKGKSSISKKGNSHIRAAMHYPALTAVQHHEPTRNFCQRIIARSGIKMKGYVAVQRSMLELMFVLHKNKVDFDKDYHNKKAAKNNLYCSLADIKNTALSFQI